MNETMSIDVTSPADLAKYLLAVDAKLTHFAELELAIGCLCVVIAQHPDGSLQKRTLVDGMMASWRAFPANQSVKNLACLIAGTPGAEMPPERPKLTIVGSDDV